MRMWSPFRSILGRGGGGTWGTNTVSIPGGKAWRYEDLLSTWNCPRHAARLAPSESSPFFACCPLPLHPFFCLLWGNQPLPAAHCQVSQRVFFLSPPAPQLWVSTHRPSVCFLIPVGEKLSRRLAQASRWRPRWSTRRPFSDVWYTVAWPRARV